VYDSKLENALGLSGDPDVAIRRFAERCVFDKLGLLCLAAPARTEGDMAVRLRIVLPASREEEVFRNYHDRCGHLGVNATLAIIARRFYVRNLSKKVRAWIADCGVCARNAQPRVAAGEATVPYRGSGPGQSYTADVYTTGYECDGYDHIFVIVDDFTGWLRAIPIRGPGDAELLLRLWKYEVTRNESLAVVIKSDRGSNLVAKLYRAYCDCYQISRRDGASGNHHSAAIAERLLQTLSRMLRAHRISTKDQRWYEYLIDLEIIFNQHGLGRGESPFYYARLRDPFFAHDLATFGVDALRARVGEHDGFRESHLVEQAERAHRVWEAHQQELRVTALRTKLASDAKRDTTIRYKPMARVLMRKRVVRGKWDLHWSDEALRIDKYLGNNCYSLLDTFNNRVHGSIPADDLTPYPELTNDGDGPLAADEFYVKTITARRLVAGDDGRPVFQYRFRFRNQSKSEDRWYLADEVPQLHQMIRVYNTVIRPISGAEQTRIDRATDQPLQPADVARQPRYSAGSATRRMLRRPGDPSAAALPAVDEDGPGAAVPDAGPAAVLGPEFHLSSVSSCEAGQQLVAPASLWPTWQCLELDGKGWEVTAAAEASGSAKVPIEFTHCFTDDGRPWVATIALSSLRTLVPDSPTPTPSAPPGDGCAAASEDGPAAAVEASGSSDASAAPAESPDGCDPEVAEAQEEPSSLLDSLGPFATRMVRSAKHGNQLHYDLDRPSARGVSSRGWFARHEMSAAELARADEYDRSVGEVLLNYLGDSRRAPSLLLGLL